MAKFNQRDFMIGAALFSLFQHNSDAKPSLLETTNYSAYFKVATNTTDDFGIYIKFTKAPSGKGTWDVGLSSSDKKRIADMFAELPTSYVFLVLGEKYKTGEVVVLSRAEYEAISHKSKIRVKLSSSGKPKKFHIVDGTGIAFMIDRNRIEKRLSLMGSNEEDTSAMLLQA